jgi:DNA ligase-associated metallophosphoesterase
MELFKCKGQSLILHPSRVIYWEEQSALILSDLHFGKTGHFRKSGIAIPQNVYKEDLQRLVSLIQFFKPAQLIVAGDLFHSHANKELELFKKWRNDFPDLVIHLVKGNHDILHSKWYNETGITVSDCTLQVGDFIFTHDPADCEIHAAAGNYVFTGHIHPGISISGMGRQSLHFPCFYFAENYCVLPAFSHFTGTYRIVPKENESVFAIVKDQLIRMN